MRHVRATTWSQLMECLYEDAWMPTLQRFRPPFAFRGLPDESYTLDTSLMRMGGNYAQIEGHLLRNFKKYALRNVLESDSFWYWLSVDQHHGLPTRMMDWTFSPYVALHFVTANLSRYDSDGVIWCVDYKKVHQRLPNVLNDQLEAEGADVFTIEMLSHIRSLREFDSQADEPFALFFEPPSIDDRIINQYALFSVISDPALSMKSWLEQQPDVYRKITIAKELKGEVRDKLDQANINERVLFPGLDGLSHWLRRQYIQPTGEQTANPGEGSLGQSDTALTDHKPSELGIRSRP